MGKPEPFNGYKSVPNPCHNPKTGDCPDRAAGCSLNCEKWAKHKESREAIYAVRKRDYLAVESYIKARNTRGRDKHYGGDH